MTLFPLVFVALAQAGPVADRLSVDRELIWAGIDTRDLQLFVPETFDDPAEKVFWGPGGGLDDFIGTFGTPEQAWKRLCGDWNTMFVNDWVPSLEKRLELRVSVSTPEACAGVQRPAEAWFMPEYEAASSPVIFDAEHLSAAVQSWPVPASEGLALMVVAERYAKAEGEGCVWPVFFDIASRQVLYTERSCVEPRGIGFRNFWFSAVTITVRAAAKSVAKGDL